MKILYLLRHAKSSRDDPGLNDYDRPLAPRGIRACKLMTAHIQKVDIEPGLILCSSARRATETYTHIADAFANKPSVCVEEGLYLRDGQTLLIRLRDLGDQVSSVMIIGHNPGLENLALALSSGAETKSLTRMRGKYPTLGLASIEFVGEAWSTVGPGGGRLLDFVIPRDLEEQKEASL